MCGLLVWLEFGLSIPFRRVDGEEKERSVPRSGGEKNYVSCSVFNFRNLRWRERY